MTTTMSRRSVRPPRRLPVSRAWSEAGFDRAAAETWRQAGWNDAQVAAEWHTASPHDEPRHLRSLRDAGYIPAQLQRVGQAARRYVAAWAAATVAPASEHLAADDLVIDLREHATSAA